jgi:hypothetical protein
MNVPDSSVRNAVKDTKRRQDSLISTEAATEAYYGPLATYFMFCTCVFRRRISSSISGIIFIQGTHIFFGGEHSQCYLRLTHKKKAKGKGKGRWTKRNASSRGVSRLEPVLAFV